MSPQTARQHRSAEKPKPPRRPGLLTAAVVIMYVAGFGNTAVGVAVLLSRYDQTTPEDVLATSLIGSAMALFGLFMVAVAAGIGRGSGLSRVLATIYVAAQIVLHVVSFVSEHAWDWGSAAALVLDVALLAVLWAPATSRYFRGVSSAS